MSGTSEQLAAVNDKETSAGKERDGDEEDDDDDRDNDDDDESDASDQPQQPDVGSDDWSPVLHASLPEWLRDNELIETGHRPQLNNFYSCLMSVFSVHSETGNIWTHLIGHHHRHHHHHRHLLIYPDISITSLPANLLFSEIYTYVSNKLTYCP